MPDRKRDRKPCPRRKDKGVCFAHGLECPPGANDRDCTVPAPAEKDGDLIEISTVAQCSKCGKVMWVRKNHSDSEKTTWRCDCGNEAVVPTYMALVNRIEKLEERLKLSTEMTGRQADVAREEIEKKLELERDNARLRSQLAEAEARWGEMRAWLKAYVGNPYHRNVMPYSGVLARMDASRAPSVVRVVVDGSSHVSRLPTSLVRDGEQWFTITPAARENMDLKHKQVLWLVKEVSDE